MNKIWVVTGGAGFIGSHVVDFILKNFELGELRVIDKLTYAGDLNNLHQVISDKRVKFFQKDVSVLEDIVDILSDADMVIHMAAESHVSASFLDPLIFTKSNTLGTHSMLEAARINKVSKFIQVSTDEVYGEVLSGWVDEDAPLSPTTPYSASKAAADAIANSYRVTYGMDVRIIRSNNVVGTRQFPEKLLPKFICQAFIGKPLTIHGDGLQKRTFVGIEDFCEALRKIILNGHFAGTYNIGTDEEYSVLEVARKVLVHFPGATLNHVTDRIFNDRRYGVCSKRLRTLDWRESVTLDESILAVIDWYKKYPDKLDAFANMDIC